MSCRLLCTCTSHSYISPTLPCTVFSYKAGLRVLVHTCHFALHIAAGWVGSLTHYHHLSFGLHHTFEAHISTCHFQPHVAGCITATSSMYSQGVSLPPSLMSHCWVCRCQPLYCSGCVTATLISCITIPIQSCMGCFATTLPYARMHPINVQIIQSCRDWGE